jgi:cysteine desulfurase
MFLKHLSNKLPLFSRSLPKYLFSANRVIYLDYQATTPIDYRVMDAMTPYMLQYYGNPHSKTHQYGWDTSKGI